MLRFLFLSLLLVSLFACSKTEDLTVLPPNSPQQVETLGDVRNTTVTAPPISFSCAMTGQVSQYLRWTGENIYTEENEQIYTGDTLLWEIGAEENGVFTIEEYFTAGSQLVVNPQPGDEYWFAEDTYTFEMDMENDSIFFADTDGGYPTSRLLYWSHYSFPKQTIDGLEFEQDGWKIKVIGNNTVFTDEGKMEILTIENTTFTELQVILNADNTVVDGPGYGFAYNTEFGFVRDYQWSAWTGSANGWDLYYQE